MSVFKSNSIYILFLTCFGIKFQSIYPYIAALIIPILPLDKPIIASIIAILSLSSNLMEGSLIALLLSILFLAVHFYYFGVPWNNPIYVQPPNTLSSRLLVFMFFISFSFLSIATSSFTHYSYLIGLYIVLLAYSIKGIAHKLLRWVILLICYATLVFGMIVSIIKQYSHQLGIQIPWVNEQWWFFLMLSLTVWIGFCFNYQIEQDKETQHNLAEEDLQQEEENSQNGEKIIEIQMKQIRSNSSQRSQVKSESDREKINSDNSHLHNRRNYLPPISIENIKEEEKQAVSKFLLNTQKQIFQQKHQNTIDEYAQHLIQGKKLTGSRGNNQLSHSLDINILRRPNSNFNKTIDPISAQGQQQIVNSFLLVPFTMFQLAYLQIPIYIYLFMLQSGKVPSWLFYLMFISICSITYIQDTVSFKTEVLLRIFIILIVNKKFKMAVNFTKFLRSIWLRSSFVFVLLILFWFSLLTVNLFHISFILIVLLFITKNNSPHSQQPSFRHKNWKYLVYIFNLFLVLRLSWIIIDKNICFQLSQNIYDILSIIGITYDYGLKWHYFNLIPLLVSGVLTVQFWTYSSRIYIKQSKKTLQILPAYRTFILKLIQILTIIYYKAVPWASHFFVIVIVISLQFSLIADLVLIFSLCILLLHMIRSHQLTAYQTLYRSWNIFLKLVSIQIALRFIFEFIKFPLIFTHISQFPIIKNLIQYQQLLGLAIRQPEISYMKNIFTKFQLMMILDFSIIAISFLTIEYYDIMIKYHELSSNEKQKTQENHQKRSSVLSSQNVINRSYTISPEDAIFIYQHFIDFKLTKWLQSLNQVMQGFSKLFLKIYYPLIGTFSCICYSYASFLYFICCVYYYLKINLKYYQVYEKNKIQQRIMNLFHLWRRRNQIRTNLIQKEDIHTDQIIKSDQMRRIREARDLKDRQKTYIRHQQLPEELFDQDSEHYSRISTHNPFSLYLELKKQLLITNYNIIFTNFLNLHMKLRFWLLFLTMGCIVCNYTSRLLMLNEINNFFTNQTIRLARYIFFMFGTSVQSPISINIYLVIIVLTVIQIKCCSLLNKCIAKQGDDRQSQSEKFLKQDEQNNQKLEDKSVKKFIDVFISLRLGFNKITERFFVILLVFVSLLQNENPFSIIYLLCAWFLNYMGSKSIQGLSWTLSFLLILQYSMIITDTSSNRVGVNILFPQWIHNCWIIQLFQIANANWISYLKFGNSTNQIFVMYLSLAILMLYQFCFYLEQYNWVQILDKMFEKINIGGIYLKIYEKISQVYEYALVYSPLFIIKLCLALYLLDFTVTNMFLSILSIIFLFKSFLLENYTNSRPFWKSYFRILQLLIVIFMLVYCILSAPMYKEYCLKFLCSPQQLGTKITKTVLLLILQIGIDLISSHHFKNAMNTLEDTLNETSSFYRVAISAVQNDKRIEKSFQSIRKKEGIKRNLQQVKVFLNQYEQDHTIRFDNSNKIQTSSESWIDTILSFMPSFIDASLTKGPQQTRSFVKEQNKFFIRWLQRKQGQILLQDQLKNINELYINEFSQLSSDKLIKKIKGIIGEDGEQEDLVIQQQAETPPKPLKRDRKNSIQLNEEIQTMGNIRKSYMQGIMPYDQQIDIGNTIIRRPTNMSILQEQGKILRRISSKKQIAEQLKNANEEEKKKLLYLKIFQCIVSNWSYFTYTLMVLEFVFNMGFLTLPFPILTFAFGIVYSYQAPKNVWRFAFLALLPPIFFKYSLQIGLIQANQTLQFLLIGSNSSSIIVEYLLMFFIVIQCLILKIAGLYDQSTSEVQCMNIALIRNIINMDQNNQRKHEERKAFFTLLERSKQPSQTFLQFLFSLYEGKCGYDYSTLMVAIQIFILIYIFCFYDQMAIRQQLTFYKMIQYNQFTTGMVVMAFIQLGFMLLDRIMTVLQLSYQKWDVTLIIKYILLITSLVYVHGAVLLFFPLNSDYFGSNRYITVFYVLHIFYFLISALQVKVGLNKESRGFMDRYSWYNGYIYMTYRAIPFLFEFKIFSDWTFTKTSLRLFDWIKYQQILGFLYVAKCNSLFLRGKILGSKIQWWKKLLMGFPLLLTIILLLFGPLILFSSLNPLASLNQITGGYLELSLKINKTNEYPFYINTHITDIHFLEKQPSEQLKEIIKTFQLDQRSIQIVHLQPFSDQYWQISEGSYNKLINQPENSLYELTMRVKFDRNETKTTPVYTLNTYTIPIQRVSQFKDTLRGIKTFKIDNFVPALMRLDNNNGLHYLTEERNFIQFHAEESRNLKKKYWVINDGITFKMASDKYSKAIFGYSVMSFYISIILVVANYFRFLFQGSAQSIIMSDIPYADPVLSICDGIYQARLLGNIREQQQWFWTLVDIIRSPDLMKALTGNYLNARLETLKNRVDPIKQKQD